MTRNDEIHNMPVGREMDRKVAINIMELEDIPLFGSKCPYCREEMWQGKSRSWCPTCSEWRYSAYKEYSSDISVAWEVVEKIDAPSFYVGKAYDLQGDSVGWVCHMDEHRAFAPTPALAICRAALLLKMKHDSKEEE